MFWVDAGKGGVMGNNQSNDYRPDPTRADRIRGGSGGGGGGGSGDKAEKKNGYRSQLSAGQSPSHGAAAAMAVIPVSSQAGRYSFPKKKTI